MDFGFFNTLIGNLDGAVSAIKSDKDSIKKNREKIFDALEEFYCLASSTLNLVMVRLTNMLKQNEGDEFVSEFSKLGKPEEWLKAQNNFKFCNSIMKMKTDAYDVISTPSNSADSRKWKSYLVKVNEVFTDEDALALFLSGKFSVYFSSVKKEGLDVSNPDSARKLVFDLRNLLKNERRMLITQESKFISSIS